MADVWKTYDIGNVKFNSEVEIIIPFHNKHAQVTTLIESIFQSVNTPYFITLLDDGSENSEFISQMNESKISNIRCMRHDASEGFGAAVNSCLSNPSRNTSWVVIMRSNVIVEGQWLKELGICIQNMKNAGIKMVSPFSDCFEGNLPVSKKLDKRDDLILKENQFLSLHCAISHRELFKKVGFLKENGDIAQEFCGRMKKHGFLQALCSKSWIHVNEN